MNKLKELFSLDKPSLFLLTLPYLAIIWNKIFANLLFNYSKIFVIFIFILFFDILIKSLLRLNSKAVKYFIVIIITSVLLFFYGSLLSIVSCQWLNFFINPLRIRVRFCLVFFTLFLIFIQIFLLKKNEVFYWFLNYYFLVLTIILVFTNIFNGPKNIYEIKSSPIAINHFDKHQKPIIFIITDEYSSPDEIYKLVKDSSVYNYSIDLKKQGWIIKNRFYSYETYTLNSTSSIFNFNLSRTKEYSDQPNDLLLSKFLKSSLYDSLKLKNVKIMNLGIFNFGKLKPPSTNFFKHENFIDEVLSESLLFDLKKNNNDSTSVLQNFANHNEMVFKKTFNIRMKYNKTFLYTHFLMPHPPFIYNNEFDVRETNTTNYIAFWNFSNLKLKKLLNNLIKNNKYRIIITGDHGYRADKMINPHYTFAAFWGFEEKSIQQIHSVQDIGSLINGYIY